MKYESGTIIQKSEYRISKQIRNSNLKIGNFSVLKIRILIIRGCFGFQI